jgi:periplasmic copper chaperone A
MTTAIHGSFQLPITVAITFAALSSLPVHAHNSLLSHYAPAGYRHDIEMRVTHGCKGSPVKEVRVKIPDGVTSVSVEHLNGWQIETNMRKLPKPVPGEGGTMITETVDEIVWKTVSTPLPPMGRWLGFRFRANLPNTPGEILYFRSVNVCEKGDDKYIDLPKEPLKASTPDLGRKLWDFVSATPGPSTFLILEKPARPQYPYTMPARPAATAANTAGRAQSAIVSYRQGSGSSLL